jgi:hypothetical protein
VGTGHDPYPAEAAANQPGTAGGAPQQ